MYRFFKPIMQLDSELKNKIEMVVPNIVYCESAEGKRVVFGPDNHIYACPDLVGRSEFKIGDYFLNSLAKIGSGKSGNNSIPLPFHNVNLVPHHLYVEEGVLLKLL
ncbi:hypothetical protein AAHB49_15690 [Bacillus cereus]